MRPLTENEWKIVAAAAGALLALLLLLWLILRRRPNSDEIERQRRLFLVESGRLIDGSSNDVFFIDLPDGGRRTMLAFTYRIGGVDYECSQDITGLTDPATVSVGFPCTVRYQPGNPHNSIVLAEGWSGLRDALPILPEYNDPEPIDTSHLDHNRP